MKRLLSFLLLIASISVAAQVSDNTVVGKWKVAEVLLKDEDPGTRQLYQGFKDAMFTFTADHRMQFVSASKSGAFGLIASKLASNDWILDGNHLRLGSKTDHYQTMAMTVDTSGGNIFFIVEGTPVRLRMSRQ